MKRQVRFILYVILISGTFLLAKDFHWAESVWAGPDHQTVPTATAVPPTETMTSTSTAATATSTTTVTETATTTPTATATITGSPSVTSTATATLTSTGETDSTSSRTTTGTIIASVIGGLLCLGGLVAFVLYLLSAAKKRNEEDG